MLKRLSFSNPTEPFLVPPSLQAASTPRTPLSADPSRSAPPSPTQQQGSYFPALPVVERATLHRSLAALSGLLVALDEVRDLAARLAKANKKVGKAQKELASTFGDKVEPGARSDVVGQSRQSEPAEVGLAVG